VIARQLAGKVAVGAAPEKRAAISPEAPRVAGVLPWCRDLARSDMEMSCPFSRFEVRLHKTRVASLSNATPRRRPAWYAQRNCSSAICGFAPIRRLAAQIDHVAIEHVDFVADAGSDDFANPVADFLRSLRCRNGNMKRFRTAGKPI
jgi:hypothetical protein